MRTKSSIPEVKTTDKKEKTTNSKRRKRLQASIRALEDAKKYLFVSVRMIDKEVKKLQAENASLGEM